MKKSLKLSLIALSVLMPTTLITTINYLPKTNMRVNRFLLEARDIADIKYREYTPKIKEALKYATINVTDARYVGKDVSKMLPSQLKNLEYNVTFDNNHPLPKNVKMVYKINNQNIWGKSWFSGWAIVDDTRFGTDNIINISDFENQTLPFIQGVNYDGYLTHLFIKWKKIYSDEYGWKYKDKYANKILIDHVDFSKLEYIPDPSKPLTATPEEIKEVWKGLKWGGRIKWKHDFDSDGKPSALNHYAISLTLDTDYFDHELLNSAFDWSSINSAAYPVHLRMSGVPDTTGEKSYNHFLNDKNEFKKLQDAAKIIKEGFRLENYKNVPLETLRKVNHAKLVDKNNVKIPTDPRYDFPVPVGDYQAKIKYEYAENSTNNDKLKVTITIFYSDVLKIDIAFPYNDYLDYNLKREAEKDFLKKWQTSITTKAPVPWDLLKRNKIIQKEVFLLTTSGNVHRDWKIQEKFDKIAKNIKYTIKTISFDDATKKINFKGTFKFEGTNMDILDVDTWFYYPYALTTMDEYREYITSNDYWRKQMSNSTMQTILNKYIGASITKKDRLPSKVKSEDVVYEWNSAMPKEQLTKYFPMILNRFGKVSYSEQGVPTITPAEEKTEFKFNDEDGSLEVIWKIKAYVAQMAYSSFVLGFLDDETSIDLIKKFKITGFRTQAQQDNIDLEALKNNLKITIDSDKLLPSTVKSYNITTTTIDNTTLPEDIKITRNLTKINDANGSLSIQVILQKNAQTNTYEVPVVNLRTQDQQDKIDLEQIKSLIVADVVNKNQLASAVTNSDDVIITRADNIPLPDSNVVSISKSLAYDDKAGKLIATLQLRKGNSNVSVIKDIYGFNSSLGADQNAVNNYINTLQATITDLSQLPSSVKDGDINLTTAPDGISNTITRTNIDNDGNIILIVNVQKNQAKATKEIKITGLLTKKEHDQQLINQLTNGLIIKIADKNMYPTDITEANISLSKTIPNDVNTIIEKIPNDLKGTLKVKVTLIKGQARSDVSNLFEKLKVRSGQSFSDVDRERDSINIKVQNLNQLASKVNKTEIKIVGNIKTIVKLKDAVTNDDLGELKAIITITDGKKTIDKTVSLFGFITNDEIQIDLANKKIDRIKTKINNNTATSKDIIEALSASEKISNPNQREAIKNQINELDKKIDIENKRIAAIWDNIFSIRKEMIKPDATYVKLSSHIKDIKADVDRLNKTAVQKELSGEVKTLIDRIERLNNAPNGNAIQKSATFWSLIAIATVLVGVFIYLTIHLVRKAKAKNKQKAAN